MTIQQAHEILIDLIPAELSVVVQSELWKYSTGGIELEHSVSIFTNDDDLVTIRGGDMAEVAEDCYVEWLDAIYYATELALPDRAARQASLPQECRAAGGA